MHHQVLIKYSAHVCHSKIVSLVTFQRILKLYLSLNMATKPKEINDYLTLRFPFHRNFTKAHKIIVFSGCYIRNDGKDRYITSLCQNKKVLTADTT